ncbi:hypothetical protein HPB49_003115 [Dermacentor silvarum]|uniref:Uncharacterized protein n=1 Tax=Dermacentor silvarum TaxID=543639 RepID=A0ACB8DT15_DERSI|nr:hypothetical protein HPB49_003115 [Dermacentor silvarum]
MLDRKIPWPNDRLPRASPFGVLLDLAYNWNIHLWFRLRPLRMQKGESHILFFMTASFVPMWKTYKEENIRVEGVLNYWNKFQDTFAMDEPRSSDDEIETIDSVERGVFSQLRQIIETESVTPGLFLLKNITSVTTSMSSVQWMKELNLNAKVQGGYGLSDLIIASDVALLETIDRLFLKFDQRSLLLHMSWFFIQTVAPLEELPKSSGETSPSDVRRRRLCAIRVEDSYWLLLRCNASLKLQHTRTVLWPPKKLLTEEGRSAIYANCSSKEALLVGYWIDAMKATRALQGEPKYNDVLDFPINYLQPLFGYNYVLNKVLISAAALSLPAYTGRGTRAMVHGGLGFSYALQLVKAINQGGLKVDANGNVRANSWAPEEWFEALARSLCKVPPTLDSLRGECNKAVANFAEFSRAFNCSLRDPMNPQMRCSFIKQPCVLSSFLYTYTASEGPHPPA